MTGCETAKSTYSIGAFERGDQQIKMAGRGVAEGVGHSLLEDKYPRHRGSTLVAAHQLNRIGYGIEIDPGYVAVTLERLTTLGLKPDLVSG